MLGLFFPLQPQKTAQCVQEGHNKCFKYVTMDTYDESWQSVAYILCYVRDGIWCTSKEQHEARDPISDAAMSAVQDAMPAMLQVIVHWKKQANAKYWSQNG